MNSLFSPGVSLINKLKYPQKFLFINIGIITFILILLFLNVNNLNKKINYAERHIIGLEYIDSIKNFLQDFQEYRSIKIAYQNEFTQSKDIAKNIEIKIKQDINKVDQIIIKHNGIFEISPKWNSILKKWKTIKEDESVGNKEVNYNKQNELIREIINLIAYIGDKSGLIVEPNSYSFYVVYSTAQYLPELTNEVGKLRAQSIFYQTNLTQNRKADLYTQKIIVESKLKEFAQLSDRLLKEKPYLKERLGRFIDNTSTLNNNFVNFVDNELILETNPEVDTLDIFNTGTNAVNSIFRLYEVEIHTLEELLKNRLLDYKYDRFILILLSLAVLTAITYLFSSFSISVLNSISELQNTALKVASGNLDTKASIRTNDELNDLADSTNTMINNLKALINREKALKNLVVSALEAKEVNDALRTITNTTGKMFKADRCFIFEGNGRIEESLKANNDYIYCSSLEFFTPNLKYFSLNEVQSIINNLFRQHKTIAVNDVNSLQFSEETKKVFEKNKVKSFMLAPLYYLSEPVAILGIDYVKEQKEFSEEEIELFEAISNQSSAIYNQAKLMLALQGKSKKESFLREFTNLILSSNNLETALNVSFEKIKNFFNNDRINIRFYNEEGQYFNKIFVEYLKDSETPACKDSVICDNTFKNIIFQKILHENKSILTQYDNDTVFNLDKENFLRVFHEAKTLFIYPIFYGKKPLAILTIANTKKKKCWSEQEIDFLNTACQQLSLGINLFSFNYELKTALENEKKLRNIITETSFVKSHKEIDNYMLKKLLELFESDRTFHIHITDDHFIIKKEGIAGLALDLETDEFILSKKTAQELMPEPGEVLTLNNIENEISNPELKKVLTEQLDTQSAMIYPTSRTTVEEELQKEVIEITVLSSSTTRFWKKRETDFFRIIMDTISLITLEKIQREQIEEIRNTFIATLTHDMKSPIIAEQKALEYLLAKKQEKMPPNYDEYLRDIYNTNEDLLKLVNNLLGIYQYEKGKVELRKTSEHIEEIIYNSLRSLKYLAKERNVSIKYDIHENLPLINVDRNEINRVISNLLSNAIKNTKKDSQVFITAYKNNEMLHVSIQDEGHGIPKSQIPKIFHRYPGEKRTIGSGLGLYISKQIITAHKGRIWFETREEKGTTFHFELPIN